MGIKEKFKHLSLSAKFSILIFFIIATTTTLFSFFIINDEIHHFHNEMLVKGLSLTSMISEGVEFGLSTGNTDALENAVDELEKEPDILFVRIYDGYKKKIFGKQKNSVLVLPQFTPEDLPDNSQQKVSFHSNYLDLIVPILSQKDIFEDILPPDTYDKKAFIILGYLEIGLDLKTVKTKTNRFILKTVFFTLVFTLFWVVLSLILVKKINRPLYRLKMAAQEVSAGNFDVSLPLMAGDEIAELSLSFKEMLHNLKDSRRQVEEKNKDLTEINRQLTEEIKNRKEMAISLAATEIRLKHLISNTPAVIYSCKPFRDYQVTFISENIFSLVGRNYKVFLESPGNWVDCVHPDDLWKFLNERERLFESEKISLEYRILHSAGNYLWVHDEIRLLRDSDGIPTEIVGYLIDITNNKLLEEQMVDGALRDPLTGLPNRTLLSNRLKQSLIYVGQKKALAFDLLFLDLDRFKNINDSLGHVVGDKILIGMGERLKEILRKNDFLARLGGDEFALILTHEPDLPEGESVPEKIHKFMERPFYVEGHEIHLTTSIGIVKYHSKTGSAEQLMRNADIAMYHAKKMGGAGQVVFDNSMHEISKRFLRLENDLRYALEHQEIYIQYQPIIINATGKISGFEALLRWAHPQFGLISPGDFIPIAEETALIVQLGNWVLQEACSRMKEWKAKYPCAETLTVSVNISGKLFTPQLIEKAAQILKETGFDPGQLYLEITETVLMEDPQATAKILLKLREMGVRLQIDDFGKGYSSLNYLQHFPVNALKIDQSFIKDMDQDPEKPELVRSIINLAHNLQIKVVSEGIETAAVDHLIKNLPGDYLQGFYYYKPLDRKEIEDLLANPENFI